MALGTAGVPAVGGAPHVPVHRPARHRSGPAAPPCGSSAGGFLISAVSVTSSGALEGTGAGEVRSLVISLCRYAVVILPAAFLLCRAMGPNGVWHAFWITEVITAGAAFWVYRRTVKHPTQH